MTRDQALTPIFVLVIASVLMLGSSWWIASRDKAASQTLAIIGVTLWIGACVVAAIA